MMGDNVSEDLHDYAEPQGRLRLLLYRSRWQWLIAGIIALSFSIPFLIAHIVEDDAAVNNGLPLPNSPAALFMAEDVEQQLENNVLMLSSSQQKGNGRSKNGPGPLSPSSFPTQPLDSKGSAAYKFNGATTTSSSANLSGNAISDFTDFSGIAAWCTRASAATLPSNANAENRQVNSLASIFLSNVNLDAAQFSRSLEDCLELDSLTLENVSLVGNLTRVYLPRLTNFVYVQNGDDKRDSYKSPETLQQTLFFDKVQSWTPWSVEKDLTSLGVSITISKGGTRLLAIKPGELYLNVKYCETILLNNKQPFDTLTLINCNVTEAGIAVIPGTLKYLNIRNAVQRTPQLADLMRRQTQLETLYIWLTFHCDWPGYELFLSFNDLPPTLKTLGINNVDTTYLLPGAVTPIKTLTIGDYTTNTTVTQGFPEILKELERINVVNMSDPSPLAGYRVIDTAIRMQVKEIAVVNLHRNYSTAIAGIPEILSVEAVLDHAGITKQPLSCFMLKLQSNNGTAQGAGKYSGRKLSEREEHVIRWKGLGFDKMDSWEDYLKWDAL